MTTIASLIAEVEKLTAPSREVDAEIFALSGGGRIHWIDAETSVFVWERPIDGMWIRQPKSMRSTPRYTASIDAVVALMERELPGWRICFEATDGIADDVYLIGPKFRDDRPGEHSSPPIAGKPTAIALLLAFLRAIEARAG